MLSIELYWSFRSPYSYLVLPRVLSLTKQFYVNVDLRIVHPAAVRNPDYFKGMNRLARPYFFKDTARMAEFLGIPFRRPIPDPIIQDPITLMIAEEQPYVYRLGRLGIAAVRRGRGLAYCDEVSRMLWDGTVDGWSTGNHLAKAAQRAGLSHDELERSIAADTASFDAELDANDDALRAVGHWGVPTIVFKGEPFFGQDRFDVLMWRLHQHGLSPR
ncbi:2-hydroxychromene-2-carboxylate isomerase [Halomonas sp. QHL1]|uniref:2-hydroxychromene-2-carboxylate isomerase n=2 Tax=Halomonadaceae TaxID=28256 RepID=UPI0008FCE2F9|nr:DsbA family protein [Halomonas sp. QHL1]OJA06595.1 disulfide bond formation protein DsbA [Halomonas sp. QHL1]